MFDWIFDGAMDQVAELVTKLIGETILGMAKFTWEMLSSAFTTEQITSATWDVVRGNGQEGFVHVWVVVMAPILVAIVCIQVAVSMLKRNKAGLLRAGLGAVFGIPLSFFAVWLIEKLTISMDEATQFIFSSVTAEGGPEAVFMRAFGFKVSKEGANGFGYIMDTGHWMWWTGSAGGPLIIGLVIMALSGIAALILNGMMIFRGFALVVAASLAPVVIMMMPLEASKSWLTKWAELVTGLLLAKPLAFSVLAFSMALFNGATDVNQTIMGLVGMVIAAMMPLVAMKFISFTPTSATSDMDGAAKGAAQAPGRLGVSVIRSRSLRGGRK